MADPNIPSPPIAHLIHGFNVWDGGRNTLGRLTSELRLGGLWVASHDYGWRGLLGVRFGNKRTSKEIIRRCYPQNRNMFIGHSNGCEIIRRISYEAPFKFRAVLINPALDCDTDFGPMLDRALVLFNPDDAAVWWARWLILHPWGAMGRYGYTGDDTRIYNHECVYAHGHSGVFNRPDIYGPVIAHYLKGDTE